MEMRAAGKRVVCHVDAHHVVRHGRHGRRVRRRPRGRVSRRRRPLYTQPAYPRTEINKTCIYVTNQLVLYRSRKLIYFYRGNSQQSK